MTRACNTFLEWSERTDKERLKALLRELAGQMATEVRSLHDLDPKNVLGDSPGSLALEVRPSATSRRRRALPEHRSANLDRGIPRTRPRVAKRMFAQAAG